MRLCLALLLAAPAWSVETGPKVSLPSVPTLAAPAAGLVPGLQVPSAGVSAPGAPALATPAVPAAFQEAAVRLEQALQAPARPGAEAAPAAIGAELFDAALARPVPAAVEVPAALPAAPSPSGLAAASAREFPGVFLQNEQEGNLLGGDLKDSSGNVFLYYRPAELRPALLEATAAGMSGWDRFVYAVRTLGGLLARGKPERVWEALPLDGKLDYLARLEDAVVEEKGKEAVWKGKTFRLLEREPRAPAYLAAHPDMENPPYMPGAASGRKFLLPEITTAKDSPAKTVREALGRTREIIADTGHAGTQYHVFLKASPERLRAQLPNLLAVLRTVNDVLFLEAALESPDNLMHPALKPWHGGRSARVRELLDAASPEPHAPGGTDPDSEKHAFVGFRYWGIEGGEMVVSLELRGVSLPWKNLRRSAAKGFDDYQGPPPERDYARAEAELAFLALAADRLRNGSLELPAGPEALTPLSAVVSYLDRRAERRAFPPGSRLDLRELSEALGGLPGEVHPSLLWPFEAARRGLIGREALDAYADLLLDHAAQFKSLGEEGARHLRYMFWSGYSEWASPRLESARRRHRALLRELERH